MHRQSDNAIDLVAVADAAQVLTPSRLLGITDEIGSGDMVMVSEFAAPQPGEIGFRPVGAGAVDAVAVLMVDPLHGKAGMQHVPGRTFIGRNLGAFGKPQTDCRHTIRLGREHLRQRTAAALTHRHDNPAFARLVLGEPAINPISGQVLRPDMAAEIGAVDLGRPSPRRQYAAPSCWKP